MATGKPAFHGKTSAVIFKAILDETPVALSQRNPILPERLDDVVSKALERDRNLRYQSAAELRADLQRLKRDSESCKMTTHAPPRRSSARLAGVAGFILVLLAAAAFGIYLYLGRRGASRPTAWEQLTFFTDSAVYPALSPDGRILAFIRGSGTFLGRGDIYVKLLPSGDAVQLTHDSGFKLAPVFSPDGSHIAYGTVDPFDTWDVPVLGGQPGPLLKNASSLSWIDNGKRLLFSEIREGLHMIRVTTNEGRGESSDVYAPPGERSMVHHSYLSPDGRWAVASIKDSDSEHPAVTAAYPREGGPSVRLCTFYCGGRWDISGSFFYFTPGDSNTYVLPINSVRGIPDFPAGGISTGADLKREKGVIVIPQQIDSAAGPNYYSYTRQNTRRNIYLIPLPD